MSTWNMSQSQSKWKTNGWRVSRMSQASSDMLESRAPPEMRNGDLSQGSNSYKYQDSKFSYNLVVLANARKAGGAEREKWICSFCLSYFWNQSIEHRRVFLKLRSDEVTWRGKGAKVRIRRSRRKDRGQWRRCWRSGGDRDPGLVDSEHGDWSVLNMQSGSSPPLSDLNIDLRLLRAF